VGGAPELKPVRALADAQLGMAGGIGAGVKRAEPDLDAAERRGRVLPRDPDGQPVKRNFVHVEDLVSAMLAAIDHPKARQQLFNISMDEPVDYGEMGKYLTETRGVPTVEIETEYYSTWLDNTKAKLLLGWRPEYDLAKLTDAAFDYKRTADDPRVIWYPG